MTWYVIDAGEGVQGALRTEQFAEFLMQFIVKLVQSGVDATDISVFGRYDLQANRSYLYFPPPTAHIAALLKGAQKCEPPTQDGDLSLLVGDGSGWEHVPGGLYGKLRG